MLCNVRFLDSNLFFSYFDEDDVTNMTGILVWIYRTNKNSFCYKLIFILKRLSYCLGLGQNTSMAKQHHVKFANVFLNESFMFMKSCVAAKVRID